MRILEDLDDNKKLGDKLSTQSLVLGKKCFQSVVILSVILLMTSVTYTKNFCLEKLSSRELYNMLLILNIEKPTDRIYFQKKFQKSELEWKDLCTLPRHATINTNLRVFQHKLLHNILYLNEMLYVFGKKVSPLFFYCVKEAEIPIHLFHFCSKTNFLWTQIQYFF